ncbi:hypothetical protein D3C85_1374370 [compost metagenome]
MLFTMMMAFVLSLQAAAPEAAPHNERTPKHWTGVPWSKMPLPELPPGARGTLQAEVSCTAGSRNRVISCRLERELPAEGNFGRNVLRSLRDARTRGERIQPGDTMTFIVWACADVEPGTQCQKLPWPEEQ